MSSVDDRIVNMQFNNKQFTQGIAESQKSLGGLEQSLTKASKSNGLTNLGNAAQKVTHHFSVMQIAAVSAIGTIASRATTAGINMVKAFTLDPIEAGFRSYETQINATQTIIANTGSKMKPVTASLKQLQTYANQTVYSFADMAQNIGTFTAAGVKLKPAVADIKGIANLAALSGSSSQQASTAMYQLSQAVAAGTVKLQDWNSVVNAGMGGKRFQQALEMSSSSIGHNVDGLIKKYGSFRQSLQSGWITGDVLNRTLKVMSGRFDDTTGKTKAFSVAQLKSMGYTEAQAKSMHKVSQAAIDSATHIKTWTQLTEALKEEVATAYGSIFKTLFGGLKGSTKLFTGMHNVMESALTGPLYAINRILIGWKKDGGRAALFDGLKNTFEALGAVIKTVKLAFKDIFPPSTSSTLANITKGFDAFSKHLIPGANTLKDLRLIFGGVFAVIHVGLTIVSGITRAFVSFFGALLGGAQKSSGGILDIFASIGKVLIAFDKWVSAGGKVSDALANVGKVAGKFIEPILAGIGLAVGALGKLVKGIDLSGLTKPLSEAKGIFDDFGVIASAGVSKLSDEINKLSGPIKAAKGAVEDFARSAKAEISKITAPFDKVGGLFENLKGKLDGVASSVGGSPKPIQRAAAGAAGVGRQFAALTNAGLGGKAMPDTVDGISKAFDRLKNSTDGAHKHVTALYSAFKGGSAKTASASVDGLAKSAQGIGDKWGTVEHILSQVGDGIKKTFSALGNAAKWVSNAFSTLFGNYDALDWASLANALFSGAILIQMHSFMNLLRQGIGDLSEVKDAIKETFGQLTGTLKAMQTQIKAKAIEAIAIAVALLAGAILVLSLIKMKPLAQSLGAISIMLGLLVGSLYGLSKVSGTFDISVFSASMVLIATAMAILAGAAVLLGKQDLKTLAKGLGSIAIALGLMVGAVAAFSDLEGPFMAAGAAIFIVANAMVALAAAVAAFGVQDTKQLAKGLGAMAIGIGLVVGALNELATIGGKRVLAAAGAIFIISNAMVALALAVAAFGSMDPKTLSLGFIAIGAGLGIMTASLLALSDSGPAVIAAAASMVLMATAMNLMVGAVVLLGNMDWGTILKGIIALTLLAVPILAVGAAAEAVGPGLIILGVSVGILGAAMLAAGTGMALFGAGFAVLAATGTAGIAVITAAIKVFMALLPNIAVQVAAAFVAFLGSIAAAAPKIRKSFDTIFQNILGVISDNIPAITHLFNKLMNAAIDVIHTNFPKLVKLGMQMIISLLDGIDANIGKIVTKAGNIIVHFINGVGDQSARIVTAGANAIIKFVEGLGKNGARIADAAGKTILKFLRDIDASVNKYEGDIVKTGGKIALDIVNGLTGGLAGAAIGKVEAAAKNLASHIPAPIRKLLGITSPSRVMMEVGKYVAQGLANGISGHARLALLEMQNLADGLINTGTKAVATMARLSSSAQKAADKSNKKNKKHHKSAPPVPKLNQYQTYAALAYNAKTLQLLSAKAEANAKKAKATADKKNATAAQKTAAKNAAKAASNSLKAYKAANAKAAHAGAILVSGISKSASRAAFGNPGSTLSDSASIALQRHIASLDAQQSFSDKTGSYQYNNFSGMADAQKSLGDAYTTQAQNLTNSANAALQKSTAEAQKAAKAVADANAKVAKDKKGSKQYQKDVKAAQDAAKQAAILRAKAAADAKAAQQYAKSAQSAYTNATVAFTASITDQIKSLQANQAAFAASQAWNDKFNAADTSTQAQMLSDRSAQEQADADAKNKLATTLMAQAQKEASTNAAQAQADLDAANQAVQDAQASANAAQQDKDQATQLLGQATAAMAASLSPSKSALEDAAKSVDRYSASLAEAESLAGASSSPVTYVQNNYSPEALSASQIYRNSKNLLAATEIKMGAN